MKTPLSSPLRALWRRWCLLRLRGLRRRDLRHPNLKVDSRAEFDLIRYRLMRSIHQRLSKQSTPSQRG